MAFARIVIATVLFFFSLIGFLFLSDFFLPTDYLDLNFFHIATVYILLFISLAVPSFLIRLADKTTNFKEVVFACIAFTILMMMEELQYIWNAKYYQGAGQIFFPVLLLVTFSMIFSLLGFYLAAKIRKN